MAITLDTIRTRARNRANMTNSQFIGSGDDNSDPELDDYINNSLGRLYDLLLAADETYFVDGYEFTTQSAVEFYDLPTNFYKLLGVDLTLGERQVISVKQYNFADRNLYKTSSVAMFYLASNIRYMLRDASLSLLPMPDANYKMTMWFIPQCPRLVNSSDTVKNTVIESYIEYVVLDAAIQMLEKEESDTSALENRKAVITQQLEKIAVSRNWGEAKVTTDVYRNNWNVSGW